MSSLKKFAISLQLSAAALLFSNFALAATQNTYQTIGSGYSFNNKSSNEVVYQEILKQNAKISSQLAEMQQTMSAKKSKMLRTPDSNDSGKLYVKLEGGYAMNHHPAELLFTGKVLTSALDPNLDADNNLIPDSNEPQVYRYTAAQDLNGLINQHFKGPQLGLGIGYNFTNNARGDVILSYKALSVVSGESSGGVNPLDQIQNIDTRHFGGTANVYYDFKNGSRFTPFITAGVGYESVKTKWTVDNDSRLSGSSKLQNAFTRESPILFSDAGFHDIVLDGNNTIKSDTLPVGDVYNIIKAKDQGNFIYQGGAGVSCRINDKTALDLTYRLSNVNKIKITGEGKDFWIGESSISANGKTVTDNDMPSLVISEVKTQKQMQHYLGLGLRFIF